MYFITKKVIEEIFQNFENYFSLCNPFFPLQQIEFDHCPFIDDDNLSENLKKLLGLGLIYVFKMMPQRLIPREQYRPQS